MDTLTVTNIGRVPAQCGQRIVLPQVPTEVPLDFFIEYGGQPYLRFDWSKMRHYLQSRTESGELLFDWHSPLSAVDGYGRHAIWLIRALLAEGVRLQVRSSWAMDPAFMPQDIRALRHEYANAPPGKVAVAFTLGYDPMLYQHSSVVKIGITQFETDRLPRVHVENVNKLDHCIVTSSFQLDVFRKSGVRTPMSVMTPSCDTGYFRPVERPMDGKFKVLMVGALTPRKNPLAAIRIFQAASQGNPDWRLTIKTRAVVNVGEVRRAAGGDERIQLLVGDDSPDDILNLYHRHDCLLWPSKGEGVGLPPLEAMATGMELVCADNSGMSDYLGPWCWKIRTAGMESAVAPNCFTQEYVEAYGDVGRWWVPDERHAARQLERCFSEWRDGHGRGQEAAAYVHANHTPAHSARDIISVVERFA